MLCFFVSRLLLDMFLMRSVPNSDIRLSSTVIFFGIHGSSRFHFCLEYALRYWCYFLKCFFVCFKSHAPFHSALLDLFFNSVVRLNYNNHNLIKYWILIVWTISGKHHVGRNIHTYKSRRTAEGSCPGSWYWLLLGALKVFWWQVWRLKTACQTMQDGISIFLEWLSERSNHPRSILFIFGTRFVLGEGYSHTMGFSEATQGAKVWVYLVVSSLDFCDFQPRLVEWRVANRPRNKVITKTYFAKIGQVDIYFPWPVPKNGVDRRLKQLSQEHTPLSDPSLLLSQACGVLQASCASLPW